MTDVQQATRRVYALLPGKASLGGYFNPICTCIVIEIQTRIDGSWTIYVFEIPEGKLPSLLLDSFCLWPMAASPWTRICFLHLKGEKNGLQLWKHMV